MSVRRSVFFLNCGFFPPYHTFDSALCSNGDRFGTTNWLRQRKTGVASARSDTIHNRIERILSGHSGFNLWFNEHSNYNISKLKCNDICGHQMQMSACILAVIFPCRSIVDENHTLLVISLGDLSR
ncbi:hypothetical protein P879_10996 [Paragonimus westermani]|uniref:Uncharacterized protein n=1 Tax=Paragonimus westermani TaxID=34504 RepID=A0A8T0DAE0_9TREM|nr:hypothetical protein P879_10996 [Paragonimus westermani]